MKNEDAFNETNDEINPKWYPFITSYLVLIPLFWTWNDEDIAWSLFFITLSTIFSCTYWILDSVEGYLKKYANPNISGQEINRRLKATKNKSSK